MFTVYIYNIYIGKITAFWKKRKKTNKASDRKLYALKIKINKTNHRRRKRKITRWGFR